MMPLYQSQYERLSSQHEAIGIIISKAGEDRLKFKPSPEKWSVKEHIAHLTRYQEIFVERINTILRVDAPTFEPYQSDKDPFLKSINSKEIPELLLSLNDMRRKIFKTLTSVKESDLIRTGFHPKHGSLDVSVWTDFFLLHEAHHLFAIFKLIHQREIPM
jgi:uncharacterized damage-inducible protein DinB